MKYHHLEWLREHPFHPMITHGILLLQSRSVFIPLGNVGLGSLDGNDNVQQANKTAAKMSPGERIMKELLWKDYRLNRGLLWLGIIGLAGVYVIGVVTEVSYVWPALPSSKVWADTLRSYGNMATSGISFIAALLGGNAIACERSDRSAHFLAFLPPTKLQILASKLMVAWFALAVFWGGNWLVMYAIAPLLSPRPTNFLYIYGTPSAALAGCIAMFGIGWFGSAYLEKPTFPVLLALSFPFFLGYGLFMFAAMSSLSRFDVFEWGGTVSVVTGVAAFAAGTRYYWRRVEP